MTDTEHGAVRRYAERNIFALDKAGGYYGRHVLALTAEKLHAKSDIAAELAQRDYDLDRLAARVRELEAALRETRANLRHAGHCRSIAPMTPPQGFNRYPCDCGVDYARGVATAALSTAPASQGESK